MQELANRWRTPPRFIELRQGEAKTNWDPISLRVNIHNISRLSEDEHNWWDTYFDNLPVTIGDCTNDQLFQWSNIVEAVDRKVKYRGNPRAIEDDEDRIWQDTEEYPPDDIVISPLFTTAMKKQ